MKRCLKIVLSLALALVLAGSLSSVAEAHPGYHTRRAKSIRAAAYTTNRNQASDTTDNTTADTAAADSALAVVPAEPEAPAQVPDAAPVYAPCYENGVYPVLRTELPTLYHLFILWKPGFFVF